jgi:hypothetical protein
MIQSKCRGREGRRARDRALPAREARGGGVQGAVKAKGRRTQMSYVLNDGLGTVNREV